MSECGGKYDISSQRVQMYWDEAYDKGGLCPCCGRFGKVYRRKLNAGMARCLIWLFKESQRGYVDLPAMAPRYVVNSREIGKLVHWGLAQAQPNVDDPSKKCTGQWRITPKGNAFVKGSLEVPSHVVLYNNEAIKFDGTPIDISKALGRHFHYRELMNDGHR